MYENEDLTCSSCVFPCLKCSDDKTCKECIGDRILNEVTGTCDCPAHRYETNGVNCSECSYTCGDCITASTNCIDCAGNRTKENQAEPDQPGLCICPDRTYDV